MGITIAYAGTDNHKLENGDQSTETGHSDTAGTAADPTHGNKYNRKNCEAQEANVVQGNKATDDHTIVENQLLHSLAAQHKYGKNDYTS